ncbi:colanic acid biosynthesis glycosyl transferase WcaI [Methylomarinovum caldicuralii]|uniref:Colanic acid biosynthesis glycosyl transferase WcaI n=1 Tax=Methylomarinovum caldicuralii TaxID=438856 RepID=A0AAU9CWA8_9GAMM|nr:glycosyltransferase WbuB [Methylomarinovum caldicuralii]BCX82252.1 colanic acid biosynthesis glycosyl transferase WcaI [Methylomarinovum caldicuralii]
MKLLLLGLNFTPELTGIGRYSGEMAAWLAARGHQVRVITAPPYYPSWRVGEGYSGWRYRRESQQGVEVWRCPLWVPGRPSAWKRIVHLASFAASSVPPALWWSRWWPDWVIAIAPAFLSLPVALLAARLGRGRCWLHIQDFEIDAALGLGMLNPGKLGRAVLGMERFLLRRCQVVSTISRSMQERLLVKGVPPERTFLLPNWADASVAQDAVGGERFRARLGLDDRTPLVLYAGNLGKKQGLEILPQVAARLPRVQFVVCGQGAAEKDLKRACAGLSNIRFLPLQPAEELSAMLSAADVHLVLQKKGAADLVMPSKLTNILAIGGRAVVTAEPDTELGRLVRENPGIAALCPPEDADRLVEVIAQVLRQAGSEGRRNKPAIDYARRYLDREAILTAFENRLLKHIGC